MINGTPATTSQSGLSDSVVRFAVNLHGTPPLKGQAYRDYRRKTSHETVAGIALAVHLPTGEYFKDRFINLGQNRYVLRPQAGIVHTRGKWSIEGTGAIWFFTDNSDYVGGKRLEKAPLYAVQGHLIYTHRPWLWAGLSAGYGHGGETRIDGVAQDDQERDLIWAAGIGGQITPRIGIKLTYIGERPQRNLGIESDTLVMNLTTVW